jgi:signal transduction histidine kinase
MPVLCAYFCVAIALGMPNILSAQKSGQVLTVITQPAMQAIGRDVQYFRDSTKRLGVEEMTHAEYAARFQTLTAQHPNFGYVSDALWFRLRIQNTLPTSVERVLDLGSVLLDSVALYEPDARGDFREYWSGSSIFIGQRAMKIRRVAFTLTLRAFEEKIYYVRTIGTDPMIFHLMLYPYPEFADVERSDGIFYGCIWGMIFCILAYNLALFFSTRSGIYLYFSLHCATSLMALLSIADIPTEYIWFNVEGFGSRLLQVSISLSNLLSVRFAQVFLESYRHRQIERIFRIELGIAVMLIVLALLGWGSFMAASLFTIVVVPTILLATLRITLITENAPRTSLLLYALAWGSCLITSASSILIGSVLDLGDIWGVKAGAIGAAVQLFIVSLALSVRTSQTERALRQAKQERIVAEEEREREHRRNEELSLANEEIRQQSQKLEEQAQSLTLANQEMEQITQELIDQRALLQQNNDALNTANIEKSEILSIAAHDLKNPLTGLKGMIEILRSGDDFKPGYLHRMSSTMQQSVDRMFDIVRNLLDLHALEEGAVQPISEAFDMVSAVKSIVGAYRVPAAQKRIGLELKANVSEVPCFADRKLFAQVVDNLVSNAVKYSFSASHVFVRTLLFAQSPELAKSLAHYGVHDIALLQSFAASPNIAMLIIEDEGPGFTSEDKMRLFQKFARLSAQPTGGEHSTGLGLSITKRLVERMNGVIWCESEAGHGARFIVAFGTSIA